MSPAETDWNSAVGEAISALATPLFPQSLVNALRLVANFDHSVMFAYCGEARPLDLFDNFPPGKRRIFVTAYQEGPFMLDPFFLAGSRGVDEGLHRLRDLAPDRFYQSEYFRSYYVQTGLSEEIGFFVHLPGGVTAVISLMRADQSPQFSAKEFRDLKACEPVVGALARQHHANWVDPVCERDRYHAGAVVASLGAGLHDYERKTELVADRTAHGLHRA